MKRVGGLWDCLTSFENLWRAARKAARGKRRRPNVAAFGFELERHLLRLQEELRAKSYTPGAYREFEIFEPKRRLISAAPYRDRVVHHALCNVLEPIFERRFSASSFACRRGKGTHAALERASRFAARYRYVLKGDVRKFFPSIDHGILTALLARKIKDPDALWLAGRILEHANPQEPVVGWFPGDDLLSPLARRRGLPIGNQTSQFFANVYLDPLDHCVEEQLRPGGYVRYCDDFVLFADDKRWLDVARQRCRAALQALRLELHVTKSVVSRVADGLPFLGFRVFPDHRRLARGGAGRMRRRLAVMQHDYAAGRASLEQVRARIHGWLGHAGHGATWRLRRRLLGEVVFMRASDHDVPGRRP